MWSKADFLNNLYKENTMRLAYYPMLSPKVLDLPVFMCFTGAIYQDPISRDDNFPYFQWIQCVSGKGRLSVGGTQFEVGIGQGMLLYPNEPHEYYATSEEPWETHWMVLGGFAVENLVRLAGMTRSGSYTLSNSDVTLSHMKTARTIVQTGQHWAGMECAKIAYCLLMDINRFITFNSESTEQQSIRLQRVVEYMEQHYAEVITLEHLAAVLDISLQHLCYLFKKIHGKRPIEYLNHVRINKSKTLMFEHKDLSIQEVARRVGFDNPGYYSSVFKSLEGITPSIFQQLNGLR
jgi:AraC family transcriptional regulator, arabinose operon regulatory protein